MIVVGWLQERERVTLDELEKMGYDGPIDLSEPVVAWVYNWASKKVWADYQATRKTTISDSIVNRRTKPDDMITPQTRAQYDARK